MARGELRAVVEHDHTDVVVSVVLDELDGGGAGVGCHAVRRVVEAAVDTAPLVHGDRFIPVVDAIVTADDAGRTWSIALVNRHPSRDVACTIKIKDIPLEGRYQATILSGETTDSYNDIEHPDRVVPEKTQLTFRKGTGKLPPHSIAIITVPAT